MPIVTPGGTVSKEEPRELRKTGESRPCIEESGEKAAGGLRTRPIYLCLRKLHEGLPLQDRASQPREILSVSYFSVTRFISDDRYTIKNLLKRFRSV